VLFFFWLGIETGEGENNGGSGIDAPKKILVDDDGVVDDVISIEKSSSSSSSLVVVGHIVLFKTNTLHSIYLEVLIIVLYLL
jgi:hypothetical protein